MSSKIKSLSIVMITFIVLLLTGCNNNAVSFEINFDSNGGSIVESVNYDGSSTVTIPDNPTKEGFIFDGWYWDNETFDNPFTANSLLDTPIEDDLTVYAKWDINVYTLTFKDHDDTVLYEESYDYNTDLSELVVEDPTREGYTFDGWDQVIPLTMPENSITLYAKWTVNSYSISFDSKMGSNVSAITQNYGTLVNEPEEPTRTGYTFDGWYIDEAYTETYTFTTMSAQDVTLYAKWTVNSYSISFDSKMGSNVSAITQNYGTVFTEPAAPTKEGYDFGGWYRDEALTQAYTFNTMPAENVTLYAKWNINQYTLTYNIITDNEDSTGYIALNLGETIVQVSLSGNYSSALTSSGRLFMWGANNSGQLGDNTTTNKTIPTEVTNLFNLFGEDQIIQVTLGREHSAALTSSGRVFMWGYNLFGQLGDGTTINRYTPTEITNLFNLSSSDKVIKVILGNDHSAALTSSGRVFMWGYNLYGQLGDDTYTTKYFPTEITNFFNLSNGDQIIHVSLGNDYSAALSSVGRLFMWGYNSGGKIANSASTTSIFKYPIEMNGQFSLNGGDQITNVFLGGDYSSATTASGQLFMWGSNSFGKLGIGSTGSVSYPTNILTTTRYDSFIQISLGGLHSAALTTSGSLYTWGWNTSGQLGDGTTTQKYSPIHITNKFDLNNGETIIQVSLGSAYSSILTSDGRVFIWGINDYGQLGDGTTIKNPIPTLLEMKQFEIYTVETYDFNQSISEVVPVLSGYTFSGWYIDANLTTPYTFSKMPAGDLMLYAKWIPNN